MERATTFTEMQSIEDQKKVTPARLREAKTLFRQNLIHYSRLVGCTTPGTLEKRITELVLSGKASTFVSTSCISNYLQGASLPLRNRLESIALALNCKVSDLMPDPAMIQESRGRRTVRTGVKCEVATQSVYGLELVKVNINCTLPAQVAMKLAAANRKFLTDLGYVVTD